MVTLDSSKIQLLEFTSLNGFCICTPQCLKGNELPMPLVGHNHRESKNVIYIAHRRYDHKLSQNTFFAIKVKTVQQRKGSKVRLRHTENSKPQILIVRHKAILSFTYLRDFSYSTSAIIRKATAMTAVFKRLCGIVPYWHANSFGHRGFSSNVIGL